MSDAQGMPLNSIVNLGRANVLIIDDNAFAMRLMVQMMMGFGVRSHRECHTVAEAQEILKVTPIDLIIVNCDLPEMDGYDFVRWLRRSRLDVNCYSPVVMIAGHTKISKVKKARDCGANFIIAQPFSPLVLLERIVWIARDGRAILETGDYAGPDRRFKEAKPPEGVERRKNWVPQATEAPEPQALGAGS